MNVQGVRQIHGEEVHQRLLTGSSKPLKTSARRQHHRKTLASIPSSLDPTGKLVGH